MGGISAGILMALASGAAAQHDTPAAGPPSGGGSPAAPAASPGGMKPPPPLAALIPEGSFLPPTPATLVRAATGERFAVFHPDASGRSLPPMALIPCATLERMEETIVAPDERPVFRVTGQVLVYDGRNYLIPTSAALLTGDGLREDGPQGAEDARPAAGPGPVQMPRQPAGGGPDPAAHGGASTDQPGAAGEDNPSVAELIRRLELERDGTRSISALEGFGRPGPSEPDDPEAAPPSHPDGAMLVRVRARLIRSSGAWTAVIDNDSDDGAPASTPMVLVPCQNLARMEAMAARAGDRLVLEVSGRVLVYRRRLLLVPTLFQAARPTDVSPRR